MAGDSDRLCFTHDDEANELLARDPFALLVGFALDQQVSVPTAFAGPLKLQQRLGTLDPRELAAVEPDRLEEAFRQRPAIHRFPGAMARRVQELAVHVAVELDGDARRLWADAGSADELRRRIEALPGFGEMKVKALGSVLARRFGVAAAEPLVPDRPTLGDVDSVEALEEYQAAKRAYKASSRA
ncbi:MAG: DNA repair protein [Thermoleophilia bacterium]|nr:DNA repair protein [Thermoleophilia bacterium]